MPRNIEIKARVVDFDALLTRAQAHTGAASTLIAQDDRFFAARHGRLKLRRLVDVSGDSGGSAELIHYHRADGQEARASDYVRVPVAAADADALALALERACGAAGRVVKRRWLLLHGQTRIHLDRVEGLGDFMELEVVLHEGQTDAEGQSIAEALMQALGLAGAERMAGSYTDLLASGGQPPLPA
jgi:adenylate cyclase class IV